MALDLSKELPDLLSSLISSPELLGKLLSVFSGSQKEGEEKREDVIEVAAEEARESDEATPDKGSTGTAALPVASETVAAGRGARREGLLRALRPYLSPSRCERLDALVRVSSMLNYLHNDRKV